MKRFHKITGGDWVNLVNSEADPTLETYELRHIQVGDKYGIHIRSGYGNFVSPLIDNVDDLDKEETKLVGEFNAVKAHCSQFQPKVTTF